MGSQAIISTLSLSFGLRAWIPWLETVLRHSTKIVLVLILANEADVENVLEHSILPNMLKCEKYVSLLYDNGRRQNSVYSLKIMLNFTVGPTLTKISGAKNQNPRLTSSEIWKSETDFFSNSTLILFFFCLFIYIFHHNISLTRYKRPVADDSCCE